MGHLDQKMLLLALIGMFGGDVTVSMSGEQECMLVPDWEVLALNARLGFRFHDLN
jgi:hypothetical protein